MQGEKNTLLCFLVNSLDNELVFVTLPLCSHVSELRAELRGRVDFWVL